MKPYDKKTKQPEGLLQGPQPPDGCTNTANGRRPLDAAVRSGDVLTLNTVSTNKYYL